MHSERADKLLLAHGLVKSRSLAQRLIDAGHVEILEAGLWVLVTKTGQRYPIDAQFRIKDNQEQRFVSRAGLKLEGALSQIGLDVAGKMALDVGQSTGGFTDCLLKKGCAGVLGIDVGRDQLVTALREDPRVRCLEGVNGRHLSEALGAETFDIAVVDVSFISQTLILPELVKALNPDGSLVSLVKPQFEVGPEGIGKGGLVRNQDLYTDVQNKICTLLLALNFRIDAYFESCIQGGDGNREFFVVAQKL